MPSIPAFSLLTKMLDERHTIILMDWLDFLAVRPTELVVYVHDNPEITKRLDALSLFAGIPWRAIRAQPEEDLFNYETPILRRMVEAARGEYLLSVNLDTIPFRSDLEEAHWLEEVFLRLKDGNFPYLTGGGVRFREDLETVPAGYLRTRQFSTNFGLIHRDFWTSALERHAPESKGHSGRRFHCEWAVSEELRRLDGYGLRRTDSWTWRVFHVQQWDDRLFTTRNLFRSGVGIGPYLNRVYEDYRHPWEWHFNYPRPPIVKLARIRLGEFRRGIGWPFTGPRSAKPTLRPMTQARGFVGSMRKTDHSAHLH
jgi:hypothetical protein